MPEFPVTGPVRVTVRTAAGNVRIAAEDRDTVAVQVEAGGSGEAARTAAASTTVEMNGDELLVETPQARGFIIRRTPPINIWVRVPRGSHLTLRSSSADQYCDGEFASADINTASGDLQIDYVTGDVTRHAASGDMRFRRIDGNLSVDGASGDTRGEVIGGELSVKTASGDVTVEAIGGSVHVNTASGDIKLGNLATGTTRILAASGDVHLGINEGTALWMDLSSISGDSRSELPVGDAAPDAAAPQLTLHVRTVSGDIKIHRARSAPAWPAAASTNADTPAGSPADTPAGAPADTQTAGPVGAPAGAPEPAPVNGESLQD